MKTQRRPSNAWAGGLAILAAAQAGFSQTYQITPLQHLPSSEYAEPLAVNPDGHVAGRAWVLTQYTAVRWLPTGEATALPPLADFVECEARGIDSAGAVIGTSTITRIETIGGVLVAYVDEEATRWNPAPGGGGAGAIEAGVTGGDALNIRTAASVGASGAIAGTGRLPGMTTGIECYTLSSAGQVKVLPHLPSPTGGSGAVLREPGGMNSLGVLVGTSSDNHAVRWDGSAMTDLHLWPGVAGANSRATDVNDSGWIVGAAQFSAGTAEGACLWRNGQAERLGSLGAAQSEAFAINGGGQVVGRAFTGAEFSAFLWRNGAMIDLNTLLPAGSGWDHLDVAYDINDRGQIVGVGSLGGFPGQGFLLTPVPCAADFNASGSVSVQDIFDFLAAYFSSDARADFNASGSVSVQDIFDFLAAYFTGC